MTRDRNTQQELRWQQPALLPPATIRLVASIYLDGPSDSYTWSVARYDSHDDVLEAWETQTVGDVDAALVAIQDRLPMWVKIARNQLAPF